MAIDLSRLIPAKQFQIVNYLDMLKKLCPRGPAWKFPTYTVPSTPSWVYLPSYYGGDLYRAGLTLDPLFFSQAILYGTNYSYAQVYQKNWYYGTGAFGLREWANGIVIPASADYELELSCMFTPESDGWQLSFVAQPENYMADALMWNSVNGLMFGDGQSLMYTFPFTKVTYQRFWLKMKRVNSRTYGFYKFNENDPYSQWPGVWAGVAQLWNKPFKLFLETSSGTVALEWIRLQTTSGLAFSNTPPTAIGYTLSKFLEVIARELDRLDTDVNTLRKESVYGLSEMLLTDWERVAGLPDSCSPLSGTVAQRQSIVHAKITQAKGEWSDDVEFLPLTKEYFIGYASTLGMTITISEGVAGEPFRTSTRTDTTIQRVTQMPAPLGIDESRLIGISSLFNWTITVVSDPLNNRSTFECVVSKLKPAWTSTLFLP